MFPVVNRLLHLNDNEGFFFLTAIICGVIYFYILARDSKYNIPDIHEGIFYCVLSALLVGRFFSFLFWSPGIFFSKPWIFFLFWKYTGISVTGGVIGGLVAGYFYFKHKKLNFFYNINLFIPGILVGQVIGRFGCFLNGDACGISTTSFLGMVFNEDSAAYHYMPYGVPLHPAQLYEMAGNFVLLTALILTGNNKWITERRIVWYALFYGLLRFSIEFLRSDTENFKYIPFVSTGQIISIAGFFTGIYLLVWSIIKSKSVSAPDKIIVPGSIEKSDDILSSNSKTMKKALITKSGNVERAVKKEDPDKKKRKYKKKL